MTRPREIIAGNSSLIIIDDPKQPRQGPKVDKLKAQQKPEDYDFLILKSGDTVKIAGINCLVQYIHRGKRRLTFVVPSESIGERPRGSATKIAGVNCTLEQVNRIDGRWTFTPLDGAQRMPVKQMADPVVRVNRPTP